MAIKYIAPHDVKIALTDNEKAVLIHIDKHLLGCQTIDCLMEMLWNHSRELVPCNRIGISFVENDGLRVTARLCKADYADLWLGEGYTASLRNSTLKPLLDEGKARIIDQFEDYLAKNPQSQSTKLLINEGLRSSLTLPLRVNDRAVGFLFISSKMPDAYQYSHAALTQAVVDRIAQAVEKIWTITKLQQARTDYMQLLGFVAHEMKSPLASLMTLGHTYLDGYLGDTDPLASDTVGKMVRVSGYLVNMVNNYLGLSRLETGEMQFNPEEEISFLADVFDVARDTVEPRYKERGNLLRFARPENDYSLTADPALLRMAIINLLDNAAKYGYEATEVVASLEFNRGNLIFTVRNEGFGFSPEQSKKLFKRFSRLQQVGSEDRKGTGLGLYLTWWIVEKHGGTIAARSEEKLWAEFTITLPGALPVF